MTGGIFAGRIPFWYITLVSLLYHSVAFLIYAIAMDGWIVIAAQLLSGMFVGQQSVVSLTYIGISYQHYVEILGPKERIEEEGKITRVKDTLFAFYNVSASSGTVFGLGLIMCMHLTCLFWHFQSVSERGGGWYSYTGYNHFTIVKSRNCFVESCC